MSRDFIGEAQKQQAQASQGQNHPSNQGALTNAIQDTGAYDIPVLGGILRGITQPANTLIEPGVDIAHGLQKGITTGNFKVAPQNRWASPELQQVITGKQPELGNPVADAVVNNSVTKAVPALNGAAYEATQLPSQANALLSADGLSPKNLVAMVKAVPNLAKVVTGHNIWEDMVNAAKNPVTYSKVSNRATNETKNAVSPVREALKQIIDQEKPAVAKPNTTYPYNGNEGIPNVEYPGTSAPRPGVTAEEIAKQPIVDGVPRGNPVYNNIKGLSEAPASGPSTGAPEAGQSTTINLKPQPSVLDQATDPALSGKAALEKRVSVGQMIPKSFWGKSNLDTAQSQAYAQFRDALSKELKLSNPDLEKLDKLYASHQNFKKGALALGGTLGGGGVAALGYTILNSLFHGATAGNSSNSGESQ